MLEIITRKIDELIPHPKNPRKHPVELLEKLEESIKTYGFTNPVLIDKNDVVLAGHARLKTAKRLGLTEVPTMTLELEGATADAYVIADNKLNELSEWNEEKLIGILQELKATDFSLTATGFDGAELEMLIGKKEFDEAHLKDESIADMVQNGETWQLGVHTLIVGKDIHVPTKANLFIGESVPKGITDALTSDGSAYIISGDTLQTRSAFQTAGLYLSSAIVWKQEPTKENTHYKSAHKTILYGWKIKGTHKWYADRKQTTVLELDGNVNLRARLIRNSTDANGVVLGLDGDVLIACQQLNRRAIVALDKDEANKTIARFKQLGGGEIAKLSV